MAGESGRDGDWNCGGCLNRNYAFRSFCNRCKQPRLLVDTKTPADSKWLPRVGDWICTGCSNNNYASREKCKKCGQPKEIAAMPAIAMPGASFPTYANSFARAHLTPGYGVMAGNSAFVPNQSWSVGGGANYGHQSATGWPFHGSSAGSLQNLNQFSMVPKGWRSGDWLCNCGFHNYSSRVQCKKCDAPMPTGDTPLTMPSAPELVPTLGTKRLASNEFANDWDNKRQNAGDINDHLLMNESRQALQGFDQSNESSNRQANDIHSSNLNGSSQLPVMPTHVEKRVKHWREGDWMCTNCNNHNYASRSQCNRCKSERDTTS